MRGWALTMQGQARWVLEQLHQGLAAIMATGQEVMRPFGLFHLAEAAGHAGQVEEGLRLLAEAWKPWRPTRRATGSRRCIGSQG